MGTTTHRDLEGIDRDELLASLGSMANLWVSLESFARDTYGLDGEVLGPGKNGQIEVRYRRSGRALFTLLPRPRGFRAQVVIGPTFYEAAHQLPLADSTRAALEAAPPYPEGRWLFLEVDDMEVVDDIEKLVTLKSTPPRRPRSTAA
ncbi:MAG TPA: DUF3788 family protein [Candidatus Limnocylindrales bacterium]